MRVFSGFPFGQGLLRQLFDDAAQKIVPCFQRQQALFVQGEFQKPDLLLRAVARLVLIIEQHPQHGAALEGLRIGRLLALDGQHLLGGDLHQAPAHVEDMYLGAGLLEEFTKGLRGDSGFTHGRDFIKRAPVLLG